MTLAFLREKTGPLHAQLEEKLDLFATVCTLPQYAEHLRKFHSWLAPLELALLENPHSRSFYVSRQKLPALERDLARLGERIPAPLTGPFPCASAGEALGLLYVIEGSSLGAQVISRHYAQLFGLTPATGLEFFTGYGPATGARWKEFLAHLEANFALEPSLQHEVSRSACAAFESIGNALAREKVFA